VYKAPECLQAFLTSMSERVTQSHLTLLNFFGGDAAKNALFTLWEEGRNSLLHPGWLMIKVLLLPKGICWHFSCWYING